MSIISRVVEFESLRLRFVKEGLAMWLVLFVLPRIDWTKGIRQVLASVVGYVKVGTRRTIGRGKDGVEDTYRTPVCHFLCMIPVMGI